MRLVRADERLAGASGVDVARLRIAAFGLGGGIAGLAGGLAASLTGRAPLTLFSLEWSLFALAVGGVAGPGTIVGPALLAYALAAALQLLEVPETLRLSFFAILVIISMAGPSSGVRAQSSRPRCLGIPHA
jgi:ABC-type branched-subunit amino acid transport system permease subunit